MIKCNMDGKYECLISGDCGTVEAELADLLLSFFFATPDSKLNPNMEFSMSNEEDISAMVNLIHEDLTNVACVMMGMLSDKEYMEDKRKSIAVTTPFDLTALVTSAKQDSDKKEDSKE